MMAIGLLAALQKFTRRVSEEPPDPNKERVETQQEEVSKVTKKEPQNKRKDDADNEVISQVGCTNLVAYNTEKPGAKPLFSLLHHRFPIILSPLQPKENRYHLLLHLIMRSIIHSMSSQQQIRTFQVMYQWEKLQSNLKV